MSPGPVTLPQHPAIYNAQGARIDAHELGRELSRGIGAEASIYCPTDGLLLRDGHCPHGVANAPAFETFKRRNRR